MSLADEELTLENILLEAVGLISLALRHRIDPILKHVSTELTPREQLAMESIYRMDGAPGVLRWLDKRFTERGDSPTGRGLFIPFRYVRIRPDSPRERHVMGAFDTVFDRYVGWYCVSKELGAACAGEFETEPRPGDALGKPLFEVRVDPPAGNVRSAELFK